MTIQAPFSALVPTEQVITITCLIGFFNHQGAQPQGVGVGVGVGGGGGYNDPEDSTVPYEATLCNCPRSLFELWQEYKFGLQGQKAAKRFTS